MSNSQPTVSEIRTAKRQAVGGGRKRCRRGKNCSAACIQSGMVCLVEMPETAGVSLSKVSGFLSKRAPSLPSDMKRELAALAPRQLERSPGAVTRTPQDVKKEMGKGKDDVLDVRAKTVAKSIEPISSDIRWKIAQFMDDSAYPPSAPLHELKSGLNEYLGRMKSEGWFDDDPSRLSSQLREGRELQKKASSLINKQSDFERNASASGDTRYERGNAKDFDFDLSSGNLRRVGDKTYFGWTDSYGSGSRAVGEGSYGSVIRNPDGTFVKRGAISSTEAELIKVLGKKDIGPRLVAADINGKHDWHSEKFVDIRKGRIAMSGVPGIPMEEVNANTKFAGKQASDIYWKALGDLHRLGVAHNDAHINNILVDDKGKGRWVDLGLAQKSPKAALAEALGSFSGDGKSSSKGNWQTRRWAATGIPAWESSSDSKTFSRDYPTLGKIVENRAKVFNKLHDYGLTVGDYAEMIATPIRSPISVYREGPWAKLTDEQAQNLINTLYDGI